MKTLKTIFKTTVVLYLITGIISICRADYTPDQILKIQPSQNDIVVDTPAENVMAQCKITDFREGNYVGVCLTKPDGVTPLRVWCAPEGEANVEQVRFYRNGLEVFRDILTKEKQCRWYSDNGSRWAVLDDNKNIAYWKAISPEEATSEMVAALVTGDLPRYKRIALSQEELTQLGITEPLRTNLTARITMVDTKFMEVATNLKLPKSVQWGAFNGNRPALLPQGSKGLIQDLPIYYNASIVLVNKTGAEKENTEETHQIFIGDLVKIGNAWKVVGLPTGDPFGSNSSEIKVTSTFFPLQGDAAASMPETSVDFNRLAEELNESYKRLETADSASYPAECEKAYSTLLTLAAKNPKEENELIMQASDLLFTAVQRGVYPQGVNKLGQLFDTYKDHSNKELISHLRLRQIEGEYFAATQTTPPPKRSDLEKAQKKHTEDLETFVEQFPKTEAGITTLMFLAQDDEYLQEDAKAIQRYSLVIKNAGNSPAAQKAQGAIQRLDSVDKAPILPAWKYLEGGTVNIAEFNGRPLIIFCWASWNVDEIEQMKNLVQKNKNLAVIGINLDSNPETAIAFLKEVRLPWKNVCENGGFDGPCGIQLGLQNVPMMIYVNASGKVVRPNVSTISELEMLLGN